MSAIWIDEEINPQAMDAWQILVGLQDPNSATGMTLWCYGDNPGKESDERESERKGVAGPGGGPPQSPADPAGG